jgi:two-component system chemotaxis response regulator CheB
MAVSLKPDLITLDVEMPVMGGLECLKNLSKLCDIPVLMLSSLTQAGTESTIQALENGAVDFVTKPTNIFNMTCCEKKVELIDKVKFIAQLKHRPRPAESKKNDEEGKRVIKDSNCVRSKGQHTCELEIKKIIAIGISTGGPKALREVIPLLPADMPAAVLVVQHMLPGFTKPLAERLNYISEIEVKEAENGELIRAGCVYIAPGDYHMEIEVDRESKGRIKLSDQPPIGGHRPAVDVLMDSIARTDLLNVIAVIMTGMGGDGSKGIKKVKTNNNGYIIAQDEKSCIVFGMPKVAIETGAVDAVVPLNEIANEIIRKVGV